MLKNLFAHKLSFLSLSFLLSASLWVHAQEADPCAGLELDDLAACLAEHSESVYEQEIENMGYEIDYTGAFDSEWSQMGSQSTQTGKFFFSQPKRCMDYDDNLDTPTQVRTASETLQIFCQENNGSISALVCFDTICEYDSYYEIFIPATAGATNNYTSAQGDFSVTGPCLDGTCDGAIITTNTVSVSVNEFEETAESATENSAEYAGMQESDEVLVDAMTRYDYASVEVAAGLTQEDLATLNVGEDEYREELDALIDEGEMDQAEHDDAVLELLAVSEAVDSISTSGEGNVVSYDGEAMRCQDGCCDPTLPPEAHEEMNCSDEEQALVAALKANRARWIRGECTNADCTEGKAEYCVFTSARALAIQEQGREQLAQQAGSEQGSFHTEMGDVLSWPRYSAAQDAAGNSIEMRSEGLYTTSSGLSIRPIFSSLENDSELITVEYILSADGTMGSTRLPIQIDSDNYILDGYTGVKVKGGCSSISGQCEYEFIEAVPIHAIPWQVDDTPNCVGFTAQQLAAIDIHDMDLPVSPEEEAMYSHAAVMEAAEKDVAKTVEEDLPEFMETGYMRAESPNSIKVMHFNTFEGRGPNVDVELLRHWPSDTDDPIEVIGVVIDWGDGSALTELSPHNSDHIDIDSNGNEVYVTSHKYFAPTMHEAPNSHEHVKAYFTLSDARGEREVVAEAFIDNYYEAPSDALYTGLGDVSTEVTEMVLEVMDAPSFAPRDSDNNSESNAS